jgi:hypothetical protein
MALRWASLQYLTPPERLPRVAGLDLQRVDHRNDDREELLMGRTQDGPLRSSAQNTAVAKDADPHYQ